MQPLPEPTSSLAVVCCTLNDVAADPDSASGKAAKARSYDVPIITEDAFARLLEAMPPQA